MASTGRGSHFRLPAFAIPPAVIDVSFYLVGAIKAAEAAVRVRATAPLGGPTRQSPPQGTNFGSVPSDPSLILSGETDLGLRLACLTLRREAR
ncbi:MAG: hypothetical protein ACK5Q5_14825 [Planctomycetaceae bacterium]